MNKIEKISIKCRLDLIILYQFLIDLLPVQNQIIVPNLIHNISELNKILKSKKRDKWKYIYINNKNITQLLYNEDENINIDDADIDLFTDFENLFYLDHLILNDNEIINYTFSKKFINNIFLRLKLVNTLVNTSPNIFELIIFSKIVLNIINNYKSCDNYYENTDEKELNNIENFCKETINKHLYIFEEVGLSLNEDEFYSLSVDEIYIKYLNSFIKLDKFDNYEYINKIANDLNLDKIYITEKMFDELNKILNMGCDLAKFYIIQKVEDLFNDKIINFYYFIIKYIYKIPFYFFQVPLLLNARNVIIFILRKNLDLLCYFKLKNEKNREIIERVDYVIKSITDNEYYFDKYINNCRLGKLESLLLFSKFFFFEPQHNDITILENVIKNKRIEKYEAILKNKDIKIKFEKIDVILEIINIFNHTDLHIGNIFNDRKKLEKLIKSWKIIEKSIKEKKTKRLRRNLKISIYNIFTNDSISDKVQAIFTKDETDYFVMENMNLGKSNLTAQSKLMAKALDSIDFHYNYEKQSDTSSILIQSYIISENSQAFSNYSQKKFFSRLIKDENLEELKNEKDRYIKSDKYSIITHVKVIGTHKGTAEYIRQLSNGQYISGGSENLLNIYEKTINFCKSINMYESQYNVFEVKTDNKLENEINLISFSQNKIYFWTLNTKDKEHKINGKLKNSSLISVYSLDENISLIISLVNMAKIDNKWYKKNMNIIKLNNLNMFCRGGKLLNIEDRQIFCFTSNDEIPNGQNKIIFYDYGRLKILGKIGGYSFVTSYNNMCEVKQNINLNIKLLLVACKYSNRVSENGILLIYINLKYEDYKFIDSQGFEKTETFEVLCFCQILLVDNNNSIYGDITYQKDIIITETEYILVGGFDNEKREGCIKLYKIEPDTKEINVPKLKYLQDIDIEKNREFQGFDGKISCITQSTITGNILVTCWDGTVHMFRPPNLDFYMKR